MPKGKPLTGEEQASRRREIFNAALGRFLEKGFQETTMREVAEAAGMGKSSLYDYFKTKDEILLFVLDEESARLTEQARTIARKDLPPDARLQQIMEMHLDFLRDNKNLLLQLGGEAQRLGANSQKQIQQRRYEYQDVVRGVIEEGIATGAFREVNPLLAARLFINSLVSVLFTSRPTGNAQEMLTETTEIFLHGICNHRNEQ